MTPLAAGGRADLVRALAAADPRLLDITAALLGYVPRARPETSQGSCVLRLVAFGAEAPTTAPTPQASTLLPARFWQATEYRPLTDPAAPETPLPIAEVRWTGRPGEDPAIRLLCPWRLLQPRLRTRAAARVATRTPDVARIVALVSRGRQLARVPYERRLRWSPRVQLIVDRSERLVPIWTDQDVVARRLASLLPIHALERGILWEDLDRPRLLGRDGHTLAYRMPPPGSLVLVLGDLGGAQRGDPAVPRHWLRLGAALRAAGCRAVALTPLPLSRYGPGLRDAWELIPWERAGGERYGERSAQRTLRGAVGSAVRTGAPPDNNAPPDSLDARAERLLRLVSPAVRIEPGFLRAVRLLLPAAEADAGTELDAWQHPAVISAAAAGATLDPQSAARLRADFADEPPELQRQVLALLRVWRKHAPQELWFEEILSLALRSRALLPEAGDLELAERFFRQLSQRARAVLPGGVPGAALAWYRRCERRLPEHAWSAGGVGEALQRLSWAVHAQDPGYRPPAGFDPAFAPVGAVRHLELCQSADCLEVTVVGGAPAGRAGRSPLGRIESGSGLVQVVPLDDLPPWADRRGADAYGDWVEFSVPDPTGCRVVQRLRWIAPGTFLMGSPEDEPGRWEDESPRYQVTIGDGFWLFDTPCTQALWTAVTGANPSWFRSPDRPVEQVSWEDVQGFITRLNGLVPGLDLTLPTEAQWEYACRAGTDSALYTGPIDILGELNAPALDPIAWYGGNSGVGFELANGYDSSDWKEQQYPNPKSGTHPVGEKQPNPWGLYDMLGNVREWVEDHWHADYSGAPTDGSAWLAATGASRVIRSGASDDRARNCRCAFRQRFAPAVRFDFLGFRCARVQVREPGGPAGAGGSGADFGGSECLRLDSAVPAAVVLPDALAVEVRTEREILTLRRIPRPAWASAMGRDRFGLWAEIAIEPDTGGGQPVIQCLRWCPPGRFLMGSPDDEPGRYDREGPRHPVTLGAGYWLFDTPCTQALWEALMGGNPSTFKTPDRPVEGVSWADAQGFVAALNRRLAGADAADERFVLPSESQWEYACRAGSDSALYTGPIEILGDANAPALDGIAWYGGNSNVGFELANGQDRSWQKDLQYPGGKAGTHPVKGKLPNDWGFYDLLGNVLEWVEDAWHDGYDNAPADGSAWPSNAAGAARIVRGGSWSNGARYCRCAYRRRHAPDVHDNHLGFRCARVQVREPVGPAAERAGPAAAQPAVDQTGRRQVRRADVAGLWGRLKGWLRPTESDDV